MTDMQARALTAFDVQVAHRVYLVDCDAGVDDSGGLIEIVASIIKLLERI